MPLADRVRLTLAAWRARRTLRRCDVVGVRARVIGRPCVDNLGQIEIGTDVEVSALPVRSHLVVGRGGIIRIGDHVRIAHGVAICAHAAVTIGDGSTLGPFAMVLDADLHGVPQASDDSLPIHIGRNVRIGAGAVILRGAVIGDNVEIPPHSVVSRRFPPKGSSTSRDARLLS